MTPQGYQDEIKALRERNEFLEARLAALEDTGLDPLLPRRWGLTRLEAMLTSFLADRAVASYEAILNRLYGDEGPESHTLCVMVCRIRQKLRDRDIIILNRRGFGYEMPTESRRIVREAREKVAERHRNWRAAVEDRLIDRTS
jgi:DNA-binding response OmpR family regulator